jgi:hypothetical protein
VGVESDGGRAGRLTLTTELAPSSDWTSIRVNNLQTGSAEVSARQGPGG